MSKRLMMIANDFPPIGGAGVQRVLYFAKYLPACGWEPIVLTVKDVAFPAKDPSLLDELPPEVSIERTESLELRRIQWLYQRLRDRLVGDRHPLTAAASMRPRDRELGRALRRWLFVPDDRILWLPFALKRLLRLHRHTPIECIYATVPCYSSGVIGYCASRLMGLPLLLDLRDPWSLDPYAEHPTSLHHWLDSRLEALAMRAADRVVTISPAMRDGFDRSHPGLLSTKLRVITNGYDAAALAAAPAAARERPFTLGYVGSLYAHHRPALRSLCAAWDRLAQRNAEFEKGSMLWLAGRCDPEIVDELATWNRVRCELFGYLSHVEGLGRLKGSSALLLLIKDLDPDRSVVTIPGKLFEYIGAELPILMIGPRGDASTIVEESGGFVHAEGETEELTKTLETLFRGVVAGSPKHEGPASSRSPRYDRLALTRTLAQELEASVSERASKLLRLRPAG